MPDELVPIPAATFDPMTSIERMIEKGIPPEKLGAYMDLVKQYQADRAAEAFAVAIRRFQEDMPAVEKRNPVYGKDASRGPQYYFADYDDIMSIAQPLLSAYGIVPTYDTDTIAGGLKIVCRIRVGVHQETTSFVLPMPTIPNANGSQIAGAALSYAKRYALCAALNIRVKGEDSDGQGLQDGLSDAQNEELNKLLMRCHALYLPDEWFDKFWMWVHPGSDGTKRMAEMNPKDFPRAVKWLTDYLAKWDKKS